MIPILYSSATGAPIVKGMGMGPLADCIECICYEQINGEFECTFKYPCTGSLYPYIREGAIVEAKPSPAYGNVYQQFKIYKISKPIGGIITVNAHHVSYELAGLPVRPFNFEAATPDVIMDELYKTSLISDDRFDFSSDLTKKISISSDIPKNLREVLLGTENSIASISKNEFYFNNYGISLLEARGQQTEVTIIYGRELVDYNQERSIENAYSHLVPYAITKNTNGADLFITSSPAVIELIDPVSLGHQKCLIRDFTSDFANSNDITQSSLAMKAAEYIENNNLSDPSINFRVSFIDLKKLPEYSDISSTFTNVGLGDNIKVLIQKLGITTKARIIATTYNVLAEEFISIEVGARRENVADTIYKIQKSNKDVARSVTALQESNTHVADFVVDEGTKGEWTYRKWDSGVAECWGVFMTKYSTTMPVNGNYATAAETITVNLPENLFSTSPVVLITPMGGGYPSVVIANSYNTHFTYFVRTEWAVTDMPIWLQVHCIGKSKY